jgi:hypothetical protein
MSFNVQQICSLAGGSAITAQALDKIGLTGPGDNTIDKGVFCVLVATERLSL